MGHIIPGGTGFHKKVSKFVDKKSLEEVLYSFDDNFENLLESMSKVETSPTPSA